MTQPYRKPVSEEWPKYTLLQIIFSSNICSHYSYTFDFLFSPSRALYMGFASLRAPVKRAVACGSVWTLLDFIAIECFFCKIFDWANAIKLVKRFWNHIILIVCWKFVQWFKGAISPDKCSDSEYISCCPIREKKHLFFFTNCEAARLKTHEVGKFTFRVIGIVGN